MHQHSDFLHTHTINKKLDTGRETHLGHRWAHETNDNGEKVGIDLLGVLDLLQLHT